MSEKTVTVYWQRLKPAPTTAALTIYQFKSCLVKRWRTVLRREDTVVNREKIIQRLLKMEQTIRKLKVIGRMWNK